MTHEQIKTELKLIFTLAKSPGEAFDGIIRLRQAGVFYDQIADAFAGTATDLSTIKPPAPPLPSTAGNTFFFGKYRGKTIDEVAKLDPAYIDWAINSATCIDDSFRKKLRNALKNSIQVHEPPIEKDDCPF